MQSESTRSALLDTWTATSSHVFDSVVAANRVALAALGVDAEDGGRPDEPAADRIEADGDLPEWQVAGSTSERDDLGVGDQFSFGKSITAEDVKQFAAASGDTNPLHLDEGFAEGTRFKGRIAHGSLVGGLISAALARVPGVVVYLSQDLEFHNPVHIGDRVHAECEIVEALGNNQYRLRTQVRRDDDEIVIDGEAVIMVDDLPDEE
ncbi:MAG: MaoC family dehydratase [Salinirussus sp.]